MLAPGRFRKGGARERFQTTGPVDRDRGVIFTCPRPRDETERSRRRYRRHSRQTADVGEGQIEIRFRTGHDAARVRKEISTYQDGEKDRHLFPRVSLSCDMW